MVMKFTLDTNCIIDLEESRPNGVYIRKLIQAWKDGKIELAVVAVSASENQKDGTSNANFSVFEHKLEKVGLSNVKHLLPIAIWDVFYWDQAVWSDAEMERLVFEIRNILFPGIQIDPPESIEENSKWRNQLCDVLIAWCHSYYKWDYLVTNDENFHIHKRELRSAGVKDVLYPKDAADLILPRICRVRDF